MLTFKWSDGSEHDFDALPEVSRQALVNRAVSHITGNEVASSVVAFIKSEIAGDNRKVESVTTDEVKAFRAADGNGEKIKAKTLEFQTAKLKQVLEGTIGVRAAGSGPRMVDPVEREMRKIAETELGIILGKHKDDTTGKPIVLPRGDAMLTMGPVTLDRAGWISRWLSTNDASGMFGPKGEANEPRIRRAAQRVVDAANAKARKAGEVAASASLVEALGL